MTRTVSDHDGPELWKGLIVQMFYSTGSYIGLQYDRIYIACFLNVHTLYTTNVHSFEHVQNLNDKMILNLN